MTADEAKKLVVGTIVTWDGNQWDLGTVTSLKNSGFYVVWLNGQSGWVDYRDTEKIAVQ